MLSGSITVGRLAGVPLRIHWSAGLVGAVLGAMLYPQYGLAGSAVIAVAFFASILGHELAHAMVARHYGIPTSSIDLWALGGMARLEKEPRTPRAEGWIAVAGPLASLVIGVGGIALAWSMWRVGVSRDIYLIPFWVGSVNAVLGLFNLLPGSPLDGGRVLRAARWARHGNRYRAMREAATAGRLIGWT